MPESALATTPATSVVSLRTICACRGVRALAWDGEVLYACRGYNLIRWRARANERRRRVDVRWESVASFNPGWWRNLTSRARLSSRLVRDGFHALAILRDPSEPRPEDQRTDDQRTKDQQPANQPLENRNNKAQRTLIAAVPGAIVTRIPGSDEFRVTHEIRRGTRPAAYHCCSRRNCLLGRIFRQSRTRRGSHFCLRRSRRELADRLHISRARDPPHSQHCLRSLGRLPMDPHRR